MSVTALIAAFALTAPNPVAAQDTRALAEAIAASVLTLADESMPAVLCIRLLDSERQVITLAPELPGLVENRVVLARAGAPAPKILGACGGGFDPEEAEGLPAGGMVLTASLHHSEDQPSAVWIDLPGTGWGRSLICTLPETVRMTTELQSDCSPRAR